MKISSHRQVSSSPQKGPQLEDKGVNTWIPSKALARRQIGNLDLSALAPEENA